MVREDGRRIFAFPGSCESGTSKLSAFVFLRLAAHADEEVAAETISRVAEVQEIHLVGGSDTFIAKVEAESPEGLAVLLRRDLRNLPGIESTRTVTILRTIKDRLEASPALQPASA